MRSYAFLFLSSFFYSTFGLAQNTESSNQRKINLSLMSGLGVSYFHYNVRNFNRKIHGKSYRFETPNFRIGVVANKSISKKISLKTGLRIGLRLKRNPMYEDPKLGNVVYPYSFFLLDENVSSGNSLFFEIPFGLQYTKEKMKVGLGVIYSSLSLSGFADLGIVPNFSYDLNRKINIGIECFIGTKTFTGDSVHDDFNNIIYFNSQNRFAQVVLEYKLTRRNLPSW